MQGGLLMLSSQRRRIGVAVMLSVALLLSLSLGFAAPEEPEDGTGTVSPQASTASLHNPTFDNHDWYEFNDRYGNWLAGSWLPDDDNNDDNDIPLGERQDWRLWYQQGTTILEYDPENKKSEHDQGIQMRPYDWETSMAQEGGIYQVIYNTIPCLEYKFTMRVWGYPEEVDDTFHGAKAGITRDGWHLATDDPAVESFPSSMKWGNTEMHQNYYGDISVTAEAWADHIAVFAYGKSTGGRTSRILWDTGSFSEVTPDQIYDPDTYISPYGIFGLDAQPDGSGNVLINWTTSNPGISQAYYRRTDSGSGGSPTVMTYTVYLPLVATSQGWQATTLNKTAQTNHVVTLSDLASGEYEYIVATKGYAGGSACETWVERSTFTVP
jgi:hypothetical protein